MNNSYFQLYSCCVLTKGFLRSIIIDTQRQEFYFIPNELYEILKKEIYDSKICDIKEKYSMDDRKTIDEYFTFLIKNEFAFYTNEPKSFPEISLNFISHFKVTNIILDIDAHSPFDIESTIREIDEIGAEALQIRIFSIQLEKFYISLVNFLNTTQQINSVEIIIPYNKNILEKHYIKLLKKCLLIHRLIIYSSPIDNEINIRIGSTISFTKAKVENENSCGNISPVYFVTDIKAVIEGKSYNTCLNKKLSIDRMGKIKNCPSMKISFGKIGETKLAEVIDNKEFKSLWIITKDQIEICKDCEFRFVCTDCRAYLKNPSDPFSKPQKCSYNPYLAKWE